MALLPILILLALLALWMFFFARQLSKPSGWFGRRVMGLFLNQGNRKLIDTAVKALGARSGERIVDAGFGGGYSLECIAPMVRPARVAGVEISEAMLDAAIQRWGEAVELHRADAAAMPFADGSFDGIVTVNTIYFWKDPEAVLREFRRILKPGGRLVLGMARKEIAQWIPAAWFGFRLYSSAAVEHILGEAGFAAATTRKAGFGEVIIVAGTPAP